MIFLLLLSGCATQPTPPPLPLAAQVLPAANVATVQAVAVTNPPNTVQVGVLFQASRWAFVIQRTTDLTSGVWQDVFMCDNSNTPASWTDTNAPANAFYRPVVMPYSQ